MKWGLDTAKDKISRMLPKARYLHTLGVVHMGVLLAEIWQVDMKESATAALLHDCAKQLDRNALKARIVKDDLMRDKIDWEFPKLWHAFVSAAMAQADFGIDNPAIVDAIYIHPTGKSGMSLLEKVIYVADYCEPLRRMRDVELIEKKAKTELDEAVAMVAQAKINYLESTGQKIHPRALQTLKAYGSAGR